MPYDEGNNFLIALQARCAETLEEGRPLWAQLVDSDPAKYLSERASFYENFGEHELFLEQSAAMSSDTGITTYTT